MLRRPENTAPFPCEERSYERIQLYQCWVPAGFPSPAEDYVDRPIDFNELLITHPAATFAVRVSGESMIGLGMLPGDIAVVDNLKV